jgi:hypothetical protein
VGTIVKGASALFKMGWLDAHMEASGRQDESMNASCKEDSSQLRSRTATTAGLSIAVDLQLRLWALCCRTDDGRDGQRPLQKAAERPAPPELSQALPLRRWWYLRQEPEATSQQTLINV